ncbi:chemotaxis protein CheB [Algoriphagus aquimarinus]|uniref:chemotaxis protein CheB n=1 Tax=Algoriphagus aquimarinus TaxID=237018 RepID=UPI0030DD5CFC|tara:strand:+ start:225303 stop:225869 length:567 start_codon:yes stop_codon:yes gene_type:complete
MNQPYLIALGASSGGLTALYDFFDYTMPDGVSYVITTHLFPHQKSILSDLIQKHSRIEVCLVETETPIQINKVYVMPENKIMLLKGDRLILEARDHSIQVNWAIDLFFIFLSKDIIFNKIAVILSGMGKDGTKGIHLLAENGAYIIAQAPDSARERSMPESVIEGGYADEVLTPAEMPGAINDYISRF